MAADKLTSVEKRISEDASYKDVVISVSARDQDSGATEKTIEGKTPRRTLGVDDPGLLERGRYTIGQYAFTTFSPLEKLLRSPRDLPAISPAPLRPREQRASDMDQAAKAVLATDASLDAKNREMLDLLEDVVVDDGAVWVWAALVAHMGNDNERLSRRAAELCTALIQRSTDMDEEESRRLRRWLFRKADEAENHAAQPWDWLTLAVREIAGQERAEAVARCFSGWNTCASLAAPVAASIVQGLCEIAEVKYLEDLYEQRREPWIETFREWAIRSWASPPRTRASRRALRAIQEWTERQGYAEQGSEPQEDS